MHATPSTLSIIAHTTHRTRQQLNLVRLLLTLALLMVSGPVPLQPTPAYAGAPSGFTVSTIASGTDNAGPAVIAFAPGNRIYIAEKGGVIRVWQNGVVLSTPFIDLSSEVNNHNERGLLGLAVHPDFPTQPYLYLYYTFDPIGSGQDWSTQRTARVERIAANTGNLNIANTSSRTVLMGNGYRISGDDVTCQSSNNNSIYLDNCLPAEGGSHVNGGLGFGPDGMLYLSIGDNSNSQITDPNAIRSQKLDVPLGKVFRIDPSTGQAPASNPFYDGNPNSTRSRVYNYGLRNPFTFTFHPNSNALYISDVGWDNWEELNSGAGKNFGWPCYDGNNAGSASQPAFANLAATQAACATLYQTGPVQAPAFAYNHGVGSAIVGGAFYIGNAYPAQYQGGLFIGDYGFQWIRYLTFDNTGAGTLHDFADGYGAPTQITRGSDGNIYVSTYNSNNNSYDIRRIRYTANGNQPPKAVIGGAPTTGPMPLSVVFSSAGSFDPNGQALTYEWDFGDGGVSTTQNPTHAFTTRGNRVVSLVVMDSLGERSDAAQLTIMVDNHVPSLTINAPPINAPYKVGDSIALNGSANDIEDGNISGRIQWTVQLHHGNHVHPNFVIANGAASSFVVPDHGDDSWLEICAVVFDLNNTSSGTQCRNLLPQTVQYQLRSAPNSLALTYDSLVQNAPFAVTSIVNSSHQLSAPDTQAGYRFVAWSDGGARSRSITILNSNQVLTAVYELIPTNTPIPSLTPTNPPPPATATLTPISPTQPPLPTATSEPPTPVPIPTETVPAVQEPNPTFTPNVSPTPTQAPLPTSTPDNRDKHNTYLPIVVRRLP